MNLAQPIKQYRVTGTVFVLYVCERVIVCVCLYGHRISVYREGIDTEHSLRFGVTTTYCDNIVHSNLRIIISHTCYYLLTLHPTSSLHLLLCLSWHYTAGLCDMYISRVFVKIACVQYIYIYIAEQHVWLSYCPPLRV